MKKLFVIVFVSIIACFAIFKSLDTYCISEVTIANIEALAEGESSFFGCDEIIADIYEEPRWNFNGNCFDKTVVVTYECSKGLFGSCRVGYVQTYYDCNGTQIGQFNNTSSGCGLF